MAIQVETPERVFKTSWFARAARKARIRKNLYRCIILANAGHYWVYEYLFAKQDRANIEDDELAAFRRLAKAYAGLTAQQVNRLIRDHGWMEVCNGNQR